ncbi:MAG: hypothetical protein Q9227_007575 [Pyrenula ochraceoflavens]
MSWIGRELPAINQSLYVVDDPDPASNTRAGIPKNKGREAMVYLTYIIENYDSLPHTVLFFHAHRFTWHNNILLNLDTALTVNRLSDARVARKGYMNFRCHLDPGCPDWIHPTRPKDELDFDKKKEEQYFTPEVWHQLHPEAPVPFAISQPCCAQFAVSGDRIRARPLSDYVRYRNWLLDTALTDEISGRIMEYSWQYIFTGASEYCPSQDDCYCDGYGICFGGDYKLQEWLDILRRREITDERLSEVTAKKPANEDQIFALTQEREKLQEAVEQLKKDAYDRGDRMRERQAHELPSR